MRMIVGLGNPGREYAHTRHNVGFDVLDKFAARQGVRIIKRRLKAMVAPFRFGDEEILLVKPQTFMNLSGQSVGALLRMYKGEPDDILVVYDDMDVPFGKIRIRPQGSSGGHKGMESIVRAIGSTDFPRIRVGIGRGGEAIDHVLSGFRRAERPVIDAAIDDAVDALEMILEEGIEAAMNRYNTAARLA
jgi:peptidyl-tRNA hydrolase, PTH1 family